MAKKINQMSELTKKAIIRKTAQGLPDRPSASGMRTEDIKKAFYIAIIDEKDSVFSELARIIDEVNDSFNEVDSHLIDKENPHGVTKEQVGLSNVDNTSDMDKPISNAQKKAFEDTVKQKQLEDYVTNKSLEDKKYATESFVLQNTGAGKIESISVNGVVQEIDENKNVNISVVVNNEGLATEEFVDDKVDNLNKTIGILSSNISSKYTKPVAGIPKEDLSSSVQDSLDKADVALSTAVNTAKSYTDTKVADLINSAPSTLDTLGEIATAMQENANVVSALDKAIGTKANQSDLNDTNNNVSSLSSRVKAVETTTSEHTTSINNLGFNKVDKEPGKGLSTHDFTEAYKNKLVGIEDGAEVNVQTDWNVSNENSKAFLKNKPTIPSKISELQNDKGFITANEIPSEYITNTELSSELSNYTTKEYTERIYENLSSSLNEKADINGLNSVADTLNNLEREFDNFELNAVTNTTLSEGIVEAKGYTDDEIDKLRGNNEETLTLASISQQVSKNAEDISSTQFSLSSTQSTVQTLSTTINNVDNKIDEEVGKLQQQIGNFATVDSVATQAGRIDNLTIEQKDIKDDILELQDTKANTADLPDFNQFITSSVNNLTNYYLKSQTYTQQEVNNLIGAIKTIHFEVVNSLPATGQLNYIYLVPKTGDTNDVYNEYIYANNSWEKIGSTAVDLSNYYNKTETDNKLAEKLNLSGGTMTGAVKLATGTGKGILNGSKNVVQISGSYSNSTSKDIVIGNSEDYLRLNGKLIYVNGKAVATQQDISDFIQNGKLTIKQNGTELGSFTANNIGDVEVDITVPEATSPILYGSTGQNTDGAMTQKATTDAISNEASARQTAINNLQTQVNNKASLDASNLSQTNIEAWINKLGITGLPIGSIISSSCKQNNAGLHLADGSELAIGGTYDDFCQYVINNQADFPITDLATYQSELTTYGQCGKYVIASTYVKLPTITKLTGGSTLSEFGTMNKAGLPDIYGTVGGTMKYYQSLNTGAFYWHTAGSTDYEGNHDDTGHTRFEASKGERKLDGTLRNDVYGKSDTVETEYIKYLYYIVVGTVTKTDIEVNIDNVATDLNNINASLNNKANIDLSNVVQPTISTVGTYTGNDRVIQTYISSDGKTWYRKWASGWKECGGSRSSVNSDSTTQIAFPDISFSTTNYFVFMQALGGSRSSSQYMNGQSIQEKQKTYFVARIHDYTFGRDWYACGY